MSTKSPDPAFASTVSFKRDGCRAAPMKSSADGQPTACIVALNDVHLRSHNYKNDRASFSGLIVDLKEGYSKVPFHLENGKYVTEEGAMPISVAEKG